ncbi:amino acid adenylation domain-containing protein [Planomonospora sp. ID67723]|uniref:non-ribosomal peptide synthetase n=1 Tax=Planomonospora sp. ID67723 TaxID=2738134 RepID=UPI0018C3B3EF|nr:non-ribosomal peptide synthetase [Planomonospora sp. ID67723]MBG0832653.1 amino acid adenylation domain-containing protein [Planomonospora sp. ID67723]
MSIPDPVHAAAEGPARDTAALREDLIRRRLAGARRRRRGIPAADRSGPLPLSFGQLRLWLLHQLDPDSPEYLVPMAMRLRGALDTAAVRRAWDATVARHEILRTRYVVVDGTPAQVVDEAAPLTVREADLTGLPEEGRLAAALEVFEREAGTPFALDREWPVRVWLGTLGPGDHVMITVYHHIAFDGWSLGVIDAEWPTLYLGYALGEADPAGALPPLPVQYGDYAVWQRERLAGGPLLDRELAYWHARLAGLPALDLPTDRPRPAVRDWAGAKVEFTVPPGLTERLRQVGRDHQATLFMVLLTAFQILLSRHTGQRDIAVGTPVAGRTLPELERMIGFTVNTLVIRGTWRGDPSFAVLLGQTRTAVLDALDHQELPFERLVDDLEPDRDMSRNPLFQVMFGLHNEESGEGDYGVLTAETLLTRGAVAKFDLNLHFEETAAGGLSGVLDYATALFDRETAERLVVHLRRVLDAVAAGPARPISALALTGPGDPVIAPPEAWAGVEAVVDRIERRARSRPGSVALTAWADAVPAGPAAGREAGSGPRASSASGAGDGRVALTYADLDREADRLAWRLKEAGVGPEQRVAVCLPRGPGLVPAHLAVWKAGGAYVPLDPAHPDARLRDILADSGATVLITDAGLAGRFGGATAGPAGDPGGVRLLLSGGREEGTGGQAAARPGPPPRDTDLDGLAYVIYTSGSTGRPKGVAVTHRNLARLLAATRPGFRFGADDVWTCFHSAAFDFSVWEIWGALAAGGRVVLVPHDVSRSPDEFLDLLCAERVTVLNQTPSAFSGLVSAAGRDDPRLAGLALRLVVFGGERLVTASLAPWFDRFGPGGPELVNMYGITETTVHATAHRVEAVEDGEGSRIGRPLDDLSAVVFDCYGDPAPPGVAGEIRIGGGGVARGYLGRPALTAERFVPDPYGPPGSRVYCSGDRARTRADGTLEFLGRLDDQITLRGHRIEPGEVESVLIRHPAVREAAVAVRDGRLVAYVTADGSGAVLDAAGLRAHCAGSLPAYMVPGICVRVDGLPLTPNGKIDRRALPDAGPVEASAAPPGAPRTRTEALMIEGWSRALGRAGSGTGVGVDEDFFEMGGDSLRAVALVGDLRAAGFDVSVRDLFERRTPARLAALADERPAAEQAPPVAPFALLPAADVDRLPAGTADAYPLSQIQAGMVYQTLLHPERGYYHDVFGFVVRDDRPFDEDALRAAAATAVRRHENLRTCVDLAAYSVPIQIVRHDAELPIQVEDLRGRTPEEIAAAVDRRVAAERDHFFDLATAPLMRLHVQIEADDRWRLWTTLHHVIVEGWSHHRLLMELVDDYRAAARGLPPAVPGPAAVRHADFVAAELAALDSPEDQAYWADVLGRHERWAVPDDWGDPAAAGEIDRVHIDLLGAYEGLLRLASAAGVPLKSVLLAAHLKVLSTFTGDAAFHTGLLCDARPEAAGADRVTGMFLNMVPFPFELRASTWRDLVREVFATEVALWPHRRFPLPEMRRRWGGGGDLLPAFFNYLDFHVVDAEVVDLTESVGEGDNEFPLVVVTLGGTLTLTTHRRAISRRSAARLAEMYRLVIDAMAADPTGDALALPTGDALALPTSAKLPGAAAHPAGASPGRLSVPETIAARAGEAPGAVAVTGADLPLPFGELDRLARQAAGRLAEAGAGPEHVVGVRLARGPELIAALLGVWYSGAAYLPLDPSWPARRITDLLADARAAILVTDIPGAVPPDVTVITPADWADAPAVRPAAVDPDTLAYIVYTSGSTGRPKGVEVTHRNLSGYLRHAAGRGSSPLFASAAYDLAVTALFAPLMTGGHVHLPSEHADPADLGRLIGDGGPYGFVKLTPSHLDVLSRTWPRDTAPPARDVAGTWIVGGETLTTALARRWLAVAPGTTVVNEYGPTEATVACTVHPVDPQADLAGERVPVGRAMPGAEVRVLDRWFEPRPAGVRGEVMIAGTGVARGYRGRPALTAERFVPDPYGPPGSRMYRSGDAGRVLDSGDLDLLGRLDDQVKIRGHRVEPGETASVLAAHPAVREAVVIPSDGRLVAYAVPGEQPFAEDGLLAWLRERVPAPLVPWRIVEIAAVPVTAGGKLDRAALPAAGPPARTREPRPPATPTEIGIAEIWRAAFGREEIDAEDDFFDLGGHSLLMLRVVGLAAERGLPLRAADILELRTVRAIGHRIDTAGGDQASLFWLRGGTREPLIAVHPAGGSSHWYLPLAERVETPVAAFAVPGLEPAADIGTLAGHYVAQLPAAQRHHLLAWSSGSVIAWEMAARLTALGRPPARLTLIDPMSDIPGSDVGEETFDLLEALLRDPGGNRLSRGVTGYRARRLLSDLGVTASRDDFAALGAELSLWRTLDRATAAYRFAPLPVPVVLVASDDCAGGRHSVTGHQPYPVYLDRWRELAGGGLTVRRLGCTHRGVFNPPYVDTLARIANEVITHDVR